ncbi:MAG: glycosyltransferase [Bacteroidales bacterium]|nr:glycosyltransferase [Bacteroidales bacterium]
MRIILCVTNDIATDRRVNRIALSLMKLFSSVVVIGRIQSGSIELPVYPYHARRFKLLFNTGPFFYAEYNIRLFFLLLFIKSDILVANDLDTLPAVFLVSRLRKLPVVYDSHEYFTEVPELIGRKCVKRIWEAVEALILPHLKYSYTVSASVAGEYHRKYGISMQVIRNLPFRTENPQPQFSLKKNNESLIIYQGSLNMGRGLETMIRAMQHIENAVLYIVGKGDIENRLKELTRSLALDEKICFTGLVPASELSHYTLQADLGISLEEKLGLNYYYALPNKLFDYIQARIPVLVTDLPEMKAVVQHYRIGKVISTHDPYELSLIITEMLADHVRQQTWKSNLEAAARELCWEKEEGVLLDLFRSICCRK